jgi:branched-chain amino acid transport system permease protein
VRSNGNGDGAPAIECRDVVFSYGAGVKAVDGVDFVAARGTIHGLIGPNGSGKSTLVDLIAGRLKPDEGTIAVNGLRLDRQGSPARARHGIMRTFQTAVMIDELSCRDNVLVGLYSRVPRLGARAVAWPVLPGARRDEARMKAEAGDALAFAGVAEWGPTVVGDVPHGVEQLTQLAASCAAGPRTLVLDEPVSGLSASETERVKEHLADLKRAGMSILLIEHQPRFVFDLCDEVTVLNAGKVVTAGPAAEVRANSRVREVYLGQ